MKNCHQTCFFLPPGSSLISLTKEAHPNVSKGIYTNTQKTTRPNARNENPSNLIRKIVVLWTDDENNKTVARTPVRGRSSC